MSRDLFDTRRFSRPRDATAFLANVLESSTEYSLIATDCDGVILSWNQGARRLYGYTPGEVIGRSWLLLHTEEDRRAGLVQLMTEGALQRGKWEAEVAHARKDGGRFIVRVVTTPRRPAEGDPGGFLLISSEISDRRLTERELLTRYAMSLAVREWEAVGEGRVGLLRRLGTALDYPLGLIWTGAAKTDRVGLQAFWSAPGIDAAEFYALCAQTTFRRDKGVLGRVWSDGRPVVVDDVGEHLDSRRLGVASRLGLRSGLAFPAVGDRGCVAVLSFLALDERVPSDSVLQALIGIGEELGRVLAARPEGLGSRPLTERELEVLRLAADGNSGPQIAEQLFLSPATIKTHFEHVYDKLGVGDRAAAVAYALRTGLIP